MIPMLIVIKYLLFLQIMKAGCLFDKENLKLQRLRNFEICTEMSAKETVAIGLKAMFISLHHFLIFKQKTCQQKVK